MIIFMKAFQHINLFNTAMFCIEGSLNLSFSLKTVSTLSSTSIFALSIYSQFRVLTQRGR
jgi:hypothetical protein